MKRHLATLFGLILLPLLAGPADAWFDNTHLAIAKAAGYEKWYNAAAADVSRVKLGNREGNNHYHNSPRGATITPEIVLEQTTRYDTRDPDGHLYGAVIASYRAWKRAKSRGKYAHNHLAFLVHYVGDLSMPLHHTLYNDFNRKHHLANDGIIDGEVLGNIDKINIHDISIRSEADLAAEVARIANLSKALGHALEDENRLMTKDEAYQMISLSASLLRAILNI